MGHRAGYTVSFDCNKCDFDVGYFRSLMQEEHNYRNYKCPNCSDFVTFMETDLEVIAKNPSKGLECPYCQNTSFPGITDLNCPKCDGFLEETENKAIFHLAPRSWSEKGSRQEEHEKLSNELEVTGRQESWLQKMIKRVFHRDQ